jgi:hypothetical protein
VSDSHFYAKAGVHGIGRVTADQAGRDQNMSEPDQRNNPGHLGARNTPVFPATGTVSPKTGMVSRRGAPAGVDLDWTGKGIFTGWRTKTPPWTSASGRNRGSLAVGRCNASVDTLTSSCRRTTDHSGRIPCFSRFVPDSFRHQREKWYNRAWYGRCCTSFPTGTSPLPTTCSPTGIPRSN